MFRSGLWQGRRLYITVEDCQGKKWQPCPLPFSAPHNSITLAAGRMEREYLSAIYLRSIRKGGKGHLVEDAMGTMMRLFF